MNTHTKLLRTVVSELEDSTRGLHEESIAVSEVGVREAGKHLSR
jgi:hypothetical protein